MPAIESVLIDSGAVAGRMPHSQSPMCRSRPSIGGPLLRHLGVENHPDRCRLGTHRQRDAEVPDDRPDDVALPSAGRITPRAPRLRRIAGGVDRFLSERPEAFSLKRNVLVLDLAAEEELLQAVVDGASQDHAAQDLAPLIVGQRCGDGLTGQEAVARPQRARRAQPASLAAAVTPASCLANHSRRFHRVACSVPGRALAAAARSSVESVASLPALHDCSAIRTAGRANGYRSTTNDIRRSASIAIEHDAYPGAQLRRSYSQGEFLRASAVCGRRALGVGS